MGFSQPNGFGDGRRDGSVEGAGGAWRDVLRRHGGERGEHVRERVAHLRVAPDRLGDEHDPLVRIFGELGFHPREHVAAGAGRALRRARQVRDLEPAAGLGPLPRHRRAKLTPSP